MVAGLPYLLETLDFELRDDNISKGSMESICTEVKPKYVVNPFLLFPGTDHLSMRRRL